MEWSMRNRQPVPGTSCPSPSGGHPVPLFSLPVAAASRRRPCPKRPASVSTPVAGASGSCLHVPGTFSPSPSGGHPVPLFLPVAAASRRRPCPKRPASASSVAGSADVLVGMAHEELFYRESSRMNEDRGACHAKSGTSSPHSHPRHLVHPTTFFLPFSTLLFPIPAVRIIDAAASIIRTQHILPALLKLPISFSPQNSSGSYPTPRSADVLAGIVQ